MHDPIKPEVVALALNPKKPASTTTKLSSVDVLAKRGLYWHRVTPQFKSKSVPAYLAFYYGGKLQSVHHVEDCEEVPRRSDSRLLARHRSEAPKFSKPHIVFKLGPAVHPQSDIRVGKGGTYGSEMRCTMLHLLTSPTIQAARKKSAAQKKSTVQQRAA